MKRKIILLLCLLPMFSFAQENFSLSGKISNVTDSAKLYIRMGMVTYTTTLKNGRFSIQEKASQEPMLAYIILSPDGKSIEELSGILRATSDFNQRPLLIQAGENIIFDSPFQIEDGRTSGSPLNKAVDEYLDHEKELLQKLSENDRQTDYLFGVSTEEAKEKKAYLSEELRQLEAEKIDAVIRFARSHPNDYYSLILLEQISRERMPKLNEVKQLFSQFSQDLKDSRAGKKIEKQIQREEKVSLNNPIAEIEMTDINGKSIKFSDFKGKYVLLDFWASWCAPCREENPNLVKIYHHYENKNFTIIGFSLDNNKNAWEKAIKEDGLTWIQVSDLKGWKSPAVQTYSISSVPFSILINPEGDIVDFNLRGDMLEKKLQEIYK